MDSILSKKNSANREERKAGAPPVHGMAKRQTHGDTEQDGDGQDSISQVRKDTETGGDSLPNFDKMVEQTGIHSRQMVEHWSGRQFFQTDWQDVGADGKFSPEFDRTSKRAAIRSSQTTERQNQLKFAHRDRQDIGTSGNSSPETGRMHEQTGIPPRQPTGQQNTREFYPQDRQNAETYKNSTPRTRQDAMTNGNPATEKSGGTKNTAHGMLAGEEREGQDADTQRVERLNAAYERDRAVLAKTDPAFARSTFRDVGHAEGSEEEETSPRQANKKASKIAEKIIDRLDELSEIRLI